METYLGIDIGYGDTKVVYIDSNFSILNSFSFPTLVAFYTPSSMEKKNLIISYGGKEFVIGNEARGEASCFSPVDFEDMKEFAPLILKGIMQMNNFKEPEDVLICASLPPGWWPYRKEFEKALQREQSSSVVVVPQGHGAFVTAARQEEMERGELVLVLDFGFNTVNYLLIEVIEPDGSDFQINKGDTIVGMGIIRLVDFFKNKLNGELKKLPDRAIKEMLKKGECKIYEEKLDFSGPKRRAIEEYCTLLMMELKKTVGEIWREVDAMVCSGGGVYYFNPIKNLPHHRIIVPERPEYANAEGQAIWLAKNIE